ncbi:F-box/LRR-repeat protein [Trifolium medium]|uniref:F-box/LRR-repeat protein n=1 Tax=Trifolium medium TaxID=97028 RepID=A0A392M1B5_9FABA|nr:F-box/LRR-repeat protein [Trifolium medium]
MADILSTLPDAILCHILSFLETQQSVATTILSKRWKYLWRSVPVLDLGHSAVADQNSYIRFIDFVYSVLLSRDPALPIKQFKLIFVYSDHEILHPHRPLDSITKWVDFVVQRCVEYLDLYSGRAFSPVALPSLKTLHLDNIWFPELRDFMPFLAGCPILEDLSTFDVAFDSEETRNNYIFKNITVDPAEITETVKVLSWHWSVDRLKVSPCLYYEWCWAPVTVLFGNRLMAAAGASHSVPAPVLVFLGAAVCVLFSFGTGGIFVCFGVGCLC